MKTDEKGVIRPCFAPLPKHQLLCGIVLDNYRSTNYVSKDGIDNLQFYAYTGTDNSFFGRLVLFDIYRWLAHQLPVWLAPNVVTVCGLICNLIALTLAIVYIDPVFGGETDQRWVYFVMGALLWTYQALDNMDGTQARRTGSSSALGELMDHICDCFCVTIFMMIAAAATALDVWSMLWLSWISLFAFHMAHWEEYYQGELIMGKFTGPTEAILTIIGVCWGSAFFGPMFWHQEVFGIRLLSVFVYAMTLGGCVTVFMQTYNVVSICNRIGASVSQAFFELIPFLSTAASVGAWLHFSIQANPEGQSVLERAPVVFTLQTGVLVAYLETRLLTQRVCRERAPYVYLIMFPQFIATALSAYNYVNESISFDDVMMAKMCLVAHLVLFSFLVFTLADQLTTKLGIKVFTIPY